MSNATGHRLDTLTLDDMHGRLFQIDDGQRLFVVRPDGRREVWSNSQAKVMFSHCTTRVRNRDVATFDLWIKSANKRKIDSVFFEIGGPPSKAVNGGEWLNLWVPPTDPVPHEDDAEVAEKLDEAVTALIPEEADRTKFLELLLLKELNPAAAAGKVVVLWSPTYDYGHLELMTIPDSAWRYDFDEVQANGLYRKNDHGLFMKRGIHVAWNISKTKRLEHEDLIFRVAREQTRPFRQKYESRPGFWTYNRATFFVTAAGQFDDRRDLDRIRLVDAEKVDWEVLRFLSEVRSARSLRSDAVRLWIRGKEKPAARER